MSSIYEITHCIDIYNEETKEMIASTFKTVEKPSFDEAKSLVEKSVPTSELSFVKNRSNQYAKYIYIEHINNITISHTLSIKSNGILVPKPDDVIYDLRPSISTTIRVNDRTYKEEHHKKYNRKRRKPKQNTKRQ